ncbi:MAG: YraN family protein [Sporomusaceae bacterium]|nr:YraN family protein [Sporomusaceae bacterium]
MNHIALGKEGEAAACSFLLRQGYQILARNYRRKCGEIDIIAQKQNSIVFVEVKSRHSEKFGKPCEAVNWRKQKKIMQTACLYLQSKGLLDVSLRFDIIEVYFLYEKIVKIQHLPDAFGEN